MKTNLITAIGTPLDENENLHLEGLKAQLEDQMEHGIKGILVAGTMGMMQLLTCKTYQAPVIAVMREQKKEQNF